MGHTYLLPALKSSISTTQPGLPHVCKEDIPLSDVPETKTSKTMNTTRNSQNESETTWATRIFEESINIYLRYGDEYMDENPVTGEPGAFHLSSTGRKEKEKPILPPTKKGPLQQVRSTHLKKDATPESKERKIDKASRSLGGKLKRKKNKPAVVIANSS